MRIAVDAAFLRPDAIDDYQLFIKELILGVVKQHSEHQFIFLIDSAINPLPALPENASTIIITPAPTHILSCKWRYNIKLPFVLKKQKADIFIGTSGLCCLTASIPQVLFVPDLSSLHYPGVYSKKSLLFYKKVIPSFTKKAAAIAVFSDYVKKEIIEKNAIYDKKITVIPVAADSFFKALEWEEKEKIKEQYAHECEYFLFTEGLNSENNLVNVLKAFSVFKKWQKTNMKLVIVTNAPEHKDQSDKLNLYKYRKEVFIAENLPTQELAKVLAGAYAALLPSFSQGFDVAVLQAMQCEVPLITSADSSLQEIAGDTALYASPDNPQEIAEQMKRIFKDEQLRSNLAATGKEKASKYSWQKTIAATWQLIQQAVSK